MRLEPPSALSLGMSVVSKSEQEEGHHQEDSDELPSQTPWLLDAFQGLKDEELLSAYFISRSDDGSALPNVDQNRV